LIIAGALIGFPGLRCAPKERAVKQGLVQPAQLLARVDAPQTCRQNADPLLLVLEREVAPYAPFRLLAVSETPLNNVYVDRLPATAIEFLSTLSSGPPYAREFRVTAPRASGDYTVRLRGSDGAELTCARLAVRLPSDMAPRQAPKTGIWQNTRSWNVGWERVFSVWIAYLFRPLPRERNKGWRPLHQVLYDPTRNFLHNRLGYDEDNERSEVRVRARADCGDTPYDLRAYFAWKFGLPFQFHDCSRGNGLAGPRCSSEQDNRLSDFDDIADPVLRFNAFIEQAIAWHVHSGTMRTLPGDETSDFYPIALSRASIRPGTVFVDAGGHALVVTQWNEDGLFAIDGHPDKTVTRRQFSPRFFRFYSGLQTGGFKAFRPIEMRGNRIVSLSNRALGPFFSLEQYEFSTKQVFYEQMDRLIRGR
jgi:hypothetical protein